MVEKRQITAFAEDCHGLLHPHNWIKRAKNALRRSMAVANRLATASIFVTEKGLCHVARIKIL